MAKIIPDQVIGIIGAGQLGYYMAVEALNMGYRVITYDPDVQAPAHRISTQAFHASFQDATVLRNFSDACDVITYEFENVDLAAIHAAIPISKLPQGTDILSKTTHRYREYQFAQSLGIEVVNSVLLEHEDDLTRMDQLTFPVLVKSCRFGYDGKNQQLLDQPQCIAIDQDLLVSEFIDFDYEISVLCVRSQTAITTYPAIINVHSHGILDYSIARADYRALDAETWARQIAEATNYRGILAVEFFVKDERIIFNEIAPRPHNSGHYTLAAANKSQFRAHIEAICGLEPGPLSNTADAVMVNVLGQHLHSARNALGLFESMSYFEYGKSAIKHNRKMGHAIFSGSDSFETAMTFREMINHE